MEMARRHVRDGEERIARQEAIVTTLTGNSPPEAAILARVVLETMRSSLELAKDHLRRIEERSKS